MKRKLLIVLLAGMVVFLLSSNVFAEELTVNTTQRVKYQTHVQNEGWQDWKYDGDMSGTSGMSYRLEGIKIETGIPNLGIEYQTHIQNIGWESEAGRGWKSNGIMSGTEGLSYRLEAIEIRLTGSEAANYDVYYQVHAQNIGWMDWAKNGERSGTAGYGYRLEGIRIQILPKGSAAPGSTENPFMQYGFYVEQSGFETYIAYDDTIRAMMYCSYINNTNVPQVIDDITMNLTDANGTILGSTAEYSIDYAPKVVLPGQRGFATCYAYDYSIDSLDEPKNINVSISPNQYIKSSEYKKVLTASDATIALGENDYYTKINCLVNNPSNDPTYFITAVGGLYDANNKLIGCLNLDSSNPTIGAGQTAKCALGEWWAEKNTFQNAVRAEVAARMKYLK